MAKAQTRKAGGRGPADEPRGGPESGKLQAPPWLAGATRRFAPIEVVARSRSDEQTPGRPGGDGGGPFGRGPAGGDDGGPFSARAGNGWPPGGPAGLGFHPDLPDRRDRVIRGPGAGSRGGDEKKSVVDAQVHKALTAIAKKLEATANGNEDPQRWSLTDAAAVPVSVDLRKTHLLSPVEDQGTIGSCTANAVIGLVEYLIRAGSGERNDFSRMFLYKNTRRLLGWKGDMGAYLRTTIKALRLFGVPPESEWPHDPRLLDVEPEAYHYAYAQNFKSLVYARFDAHDGSGEYTLDAVQRALTDGFPVAFGFPVYESIESAGPFGRIPLPQGSQDRLTGGHAVLAVGYDDAIDVVGADRPGALLIRNSWGTGWGDRGYGWLPYQYVTERLATDFWSIFNSEWVDLGKFE